MPGQHHLNPPNHTAKSAVSPSGPSLKRGRNRLGAPSPYASDPHCDWSTTRPPAPAAMRPQRTRVTEIRSDLTLVSASIVHWRSAPPPRLLEQDNKAAFQFLDSPRAAGSGGLIASFQAAPQASFRQFYCSLARGVRLIEVLSGRRETHSRYLWNTRRECRAGSKCAVVLADFVFGRLPKLHLRHV
jgi:hypothetical protein